VRSVRQVVVRRTLRRWMVLFAGVAGLLSVAGGAVSVPDGGEQRVAAFVVVDDGEMQHCEPLRHA
jgi:hypothetical protein